MRADGSRNAGNWRLQGSTLLQVAQQAAGGGHHDVDVRLEGWHLVNARVATRNAH
jgi:hypothetical protein